IRRWSSTRPARTCASATTAVATAATGATVVAAFASVAELLCARFVSARAELRGADRLALPIPGVQSAGTAPLGVPCWLCARFASAQAELRGADRLALPIPVSSQPE